MVRRRGAIELTYKDPSGRIASEILYRDSEQRIELVEEGRPWSFDGEGVCFDWFLKRTAFVLPIF